MPTLHSNPAQEISSFDKPNPNITRMSFNHQSAAMKSENQVNGTAQNGVTIRNHRPGDMGFITYRHGAIYADEFDYGSSFEALVGRITSEFITTFDPTAERCWIAERNGQFLGCIILMKDRDTPGRAKLRCFLVEKSARGLGLGTQLMKLCIDFAREVGYERVGLRTDSNMVRARRMYAKTGFKILGTEEHRTWGEHIQSTGENWEMDL